MARFKVRLSDGSVIGPMDREELRSWYERGLIDGNSLVQGTSWTGWKRLADTVDVARWRGSARGKGALPEAALPEATPPTVGRRIPWQRAAIILVSALGLGTLLVMGARWFGGRRETDEEDRIRAAASLERRYVDETVGLTIELKGGWAILEKGQQVFPAPEDARLALADPASGTVGYLLVESPQRGYSSLDAYLSRVLETRRRILPSLKEPTFSNVSVGGFKGRQMTGSWEAKGARLRDVITVWKDGWTYFTLAARGPEGRPLTVASACQEILSGFSLQGQLGRRLDEAVQSVTREAPHLSPEAAEMLMGQSAALILEPQDAFRRAYQALGQALPSFTAKETSELGALHSAVYASLPGRDQGRLGRYIEGVRTRRPTAPAEDLEMSRVMKTAVMKLPPAKRARLQAIFERAIAAAIRAQEGAGP